MAHQKQFDDQDKFLGKLRTICLGYPEAKEKISHGRPCFYTKNIFAIYGAVVKGNTQSVGHERSLVFKPDAAELEAFKQDPRFFIPAYWGPYGWMGIDLDSGTDWEEVEELIEDSLLQTVSNKLKKVIEANSKN